MKRVMLVSLAFAMGILLLASEGISQPPVGKGGKQGKGGGEKGGPRFELGQIFPPPLVEELNLTPEQLKQLDAYKDDLKSQLTKLLTPEQLKMVENFQPRGGGGPGGGKAGKGGKGGSGRTPPERAANLKVDPSDLPINLVKNPRMTETGTPPNIPFHYRVSGDAIWTQCGTKSEFTDRGIAFNSSQMAGKSKTASVTQDVTGFPGGVGKWFRFTVRGLAEPNFIIDKGELALKVDYFSKQGTNPLDGVKREIYSVVERDRKDLAENGLYRKNGGAIWKTYALEFRLPFTEIDTLRVGVSYANVSAKPAKSSEFYVTEFQLVDIPSPENAPKVVKKATGYEPDRKSLIHLGGRWYFEPDANMKERPATLTVTAANAHRLYYQDAKLVNPFAESMTSWLRKGHIDLAGKLVEEDRFLPDNVVLEFRDGKEMVVHARNIPNHPTAQFPGYNPNSIQEHDYTYYLPLEPVRNPKAIAMNVSNSNRGLPMGTIGFAINGVAFFNPFDAGMEDATDLMDRCCGHPSPDNRYHYHKYPVCVKTPFVDEGEEHSPIIGWALDGFPIYGPYVSKRLMAKDATDPPLDAFNMRFDEARGWHYHVTPGRYPYLIGGYAGTVNPRNRR